MTTQGIATRRLVLRPWRETDAPDLFKYASDPRVSEMALWPRHTSVEMSRQVIRDYFMTQPHTFAMVSKSTGEVIGCIGLVAAGQEHFEPLEGEREVGYWIGHPFWGRGLTTEALEALIDYCRNVLGLTSLLITTDDRNTASQCVARKCRFALIGRYTWGDTCSSAWRLSLK